MKGCNNRFTIQILRKSLERSNPENSQFDPNLRKADVQCRRKTSNPILRKANKQILSTKANLSFEGY